MICDSRWQSMAINDNKHGQQQFMVVGSDNNGG